LVTLEKQGKGEKGVYMIRAQLEDVMKKRGLERIMNTVGQPFDPSLHEAIAEAESLPLSQTQTEAPLSLLYFQSSDFNHESTTSYFPFNSSCKLNKLPFR
jgi:hypothetical protein